MRYSDECGLQSRIGNNMNDYSPLVSSIVITYNSSAYIVETLESIKSQTYTNIELIISDDCSSDKTVDICKNWLEENNTFFVNSKIIESPVNTGISANCNRGLQGVNGDWVKFIAGDDALMDFCISDYIDIIRKNNDIWVLHADVYRYKDFFAPENKIEPKSTTARRDLKFNENNITAKEQFEILLRSCPVYAATTFIKKEVFDLVGGFNENFRNWEDRPLWLKITESGLKFHFYDKPCAKYRVRSSSVQHASSTDRIYSRFHMERDHYYAKNYAKYLPIFEKIIILAEIYRIKIFNKIGLNKKIIFINYFDKFISFPFEAIRLYLYQKKCHKNPKKIFEMVHMYVTRFL